MDMLMQNDDLKSLVTQMYDDLLNYIDLEENTTKEQVVEYLKDAVSVVENLNDEDLDSIKHAKLTFTNAYKEIANKSLLSYKDTSGKFQELTQMHVETLNECHEPHINLPELTQKFNDIQQHMSDEVLKANSVISQLTEQVKKLEETTQIDALTKVFNRRALIKYLNKICAIKRGNYAPQLLMLDIDDFKKVNDIYGHIAGDKILIFIANILKKTLRDGDKIFRYGGEEFIIILNRIDDQRCKAITLRLLELVRSNKLIYKGKNIQVTTSIGATKYRVGDTPDTFIARADSALYKAKESGKNQMFSEI